MNKKGIKNILKDYSNNSMSFFNIYIIKTIFLS